MENKREKPVGIMGWHQMYNFGTQLQITALTQVVRMMGYYPEIIDYSPTNEMYRIKKNMLFAMLRVLRRVNYMKNPEYLSDARRKIFDSYKKEYFCFSDKCEFSSELYMLNEQYGAFVCGSDQIWNPYYGDDKYFLDFVENSSKKIAYAPSFGVDSLPNNYVLNKYKRLLEGFNAISIREVQGQEVLSRMGISDAPVVLDPVLLLDKEGWNDLLDLQPLQRDDYILCYFLGNIRKYLRYIRKLQKKLQKKVIVIATRNKDLKLPFEIYDEIGPKEFLLLIQGASFICTDSFHGVCFSVIY
ncbi:MAG: polysaccharide pyruvyl transferase family protein, partial [Anaeroplasmataceae bacterium]|nr:polysaccharide pyruvyl transferase family protein [Anaeroplasmataceae bacterium]